MPFVIKYKECIHYKEGKYAEFKLNCHLISQELPMWCIIEMGVTKCKDYTNVRVEK